MIRKFHGVDLHKQYATILVRNERGEEVAFCGKEENFQGHVSTLGAEDAVILEAASGAYHWAELIERQGAKCVIIDAYRFRIIRDSWHKTDRRDAANLATALWLSEITGQVRLPEVYKPAVIIRELRRLFGMWQVLTKQIRQLKNQVHGVLTESGVFDRRLGTQMVDYPAKGKQTLSELELPEASRFCIATSLELLLTLGQHREKLRGQIYRTGRPLDDQVRLLMGIRGVTALLALAFLAEVGDIRRLKSLRGMNAYLGVVPTVRSSGGLLRLATSHDRVVRWPGLCSHRRCTM